MEIKAVTDENFSKRKKSILLRFDKHNLRCSELVFAYSSAQTYIRYFCFGGNKSSWSKCKNKGKQSAFKDHTPSHLQSWYCERRSSATGNFSVAQRLSFDSTDLLAWKSESCDLKRNILIHFKSSVGRCFREIWKSNLPVRRPPFFWVRPA